MSSVCKCLQMIHSVSLQPLTYHSTPSHNYSETTKQFKQAFNLAPILQHYDPHLLFIVEIDASKDGVGDESFFVDYTTEAKPTTNDTILFLLHCHKLEY